MMEVWEENIRDAWTSAKNKGEVKELGVTFKGARQGFYVPRYLIEGDAKRRIKPQAPNLKSVSDLPKYKELFLDKEERNKVGTKLNN